MFGQPPKVGLGSEVPQEFLLKVPDKINVNDYHKEQKNEDGEIENTVPEANIPVAITEDSINDQEVTEDTSFELDAAFDGILEKNDCELLQQEHQAKDGSGISEFDRERGDLANLIGIVLAEKGGKFKVGTKHIIVDTWIERNSLQSTRFKKLKLNDVPNYETNI
nr:unnamed protein product [Callosobruchus chinensis]